MPQLLIILVAAALVVAAAAYWGRARLVFALRIVDGCVTLASGSAPEAFVADVEAICRLWKIRDGLIRGYGYGGRATRITVHGPATVCAQAVRNAWRHPIE